MNYMRALGYISYVVELLVLIPQYRDMPKENFAAGIADILYRAVDSGLRGKAARSVNRVKLTEAVRQVVDVVTDIW